MNRNAKDQYTAQLLDWENELTLLLEEDASTKELQDVRDLIKKQKVKIKALDDNVKIYARVDLTDFLKSTQIALEPNIIQC